MSVFARMQRCVGVGVLFASAAVGLHAQGKPATDSVIVREINKLRDMPDAERGAKTGAIALEIRSLPASARKVALADGLSHLATEGDPGKENLQAVTTTLAQALNETPAAGKGDGPAGPYMDLARLVRYEGMTAEVADPQFARATAMLVANDVEAETIDFTLNPLEGKKKVKLSELRGKIVVVNFWATWCPPCRKELPSLDAIARHFSDQVVILALTDEEPSKVGSFLGSSTLGFTVLLDQSGKVAKQFHVDGIPHTFVFDKDGKLQPNPLTCARNGSS